MSCIVAAWRIHGIPSRNATNAVSTYLEQKYLGVNQSCSNYRLTLNCFSSVWTWYPWRCKWKKSWTLFLFVEGGVVIGFRGHVLLGGHPYTVPRRQALELNVVREGRRLTLLVFPSRCFVCCPLGRRSTGETGVILFFFFNQSFVFKSKDLLSDQHLKSETLKCWELVVMKC